MGTGPSLKRVSVLTEVAGVPKAFDYEVPPEFNGPLEVGSRLRVPLHGRSVRAWIVDDSSTLTLEGIKSVSASLGFGPPPALVDLCGWAAWRWASIPVRFLAAASPTRLVRSLPGRPTPPPVPVPVGPIATWGRDLAKRAGSSVFTLGPASDPFDAIVAAYDELRARRALDEGSLVIVVPGVDYAGRLTARLGRAGVPAIDLGEGWDGARSGWPVVVGTRMAAFAPIPTLAGAIVLDGEDERLRSEAAPTWHALDVLAERARREGAPLGVTTVCPPAWIGRDRASVAMSHEELAADWPTIVVADRRSSDPRTGWLSEELVELGRRAFEQQPEGIALACVVNRKGRAKLLACKRCDAIATCAACDAACTLDEVLRCPRCGQERPVICASCGATAMKLLRPGTAQLAVELGRLFGVPVAELTADSDPAALAGARAVVGTEAVLHRLRRTRLVAFLDLDHHLVAPRIGVELATLGLIGRAGRLVGRRGDERSGVVLLQTRLVDHPVIDAAVAGDPMPVADADADLRQQLALPPFCAAALLRGPGAPAYGEALAAADLDVRPLGDERVAVLAPSHVVLCDALAATARPKERVVVSVDDESF